jgi:hypothetical protein
MRVLEAINLFDVEILDHLDREIEVPTVTRQACQGDVSILRVTTDPATKAVPATGVAVVRGENGGNTHSLHGNGPIFFDQPKRGDGELVLGTLTVPAESEAVMAHPEHGFLAIAPGTYRIGRQREWAGEWRMVAD